MAADIAPILDDNSLVEIRPVTLDAGVPVSYGVPMPVKLADAKSYFGAGGVPAAATLTTIGGVKIAAAVPALVNNSGGTSGGNTIAAVTDVATAANAIATLATKLNTLMANMRTAGELAP